MFGIFLLFFVTLMQIYVFWRASSVPFLKRNISKKLLIGAGIVLWSVFFLGRYLGRGGTGLLATALEFLGMNWMAIVFLLTVSLLAVDLITVGGFLVPRLAPLLRGLALVVSGLLSSVALVQGMRLPVVQSYDVYLKGLPEKMNGTVIVALSDLHIGTMIGKQWLEARVDQVKAQQPDLVVLLGDIFEGHSQPPEELVSVLHRLSAPLGVWAVLGNHEFHSRSDKDTFLPYPDGIEVLKNSWIEVKPALILAGVDDLTAKHRSSQGGDFISKALTGRPPGATVLLSHTPWQVDKAASEGVGLMLSGHTHGGQIWPFGYLVQHRYPLLEGRYEVNGLTVIVCRGTGTWGPRMRLWRPGEILRVTLYAKDKEVE